MRIKRGKTQEISINSGSIPKPPKVLYKINVMNKSQIQFNRPMSPAQKSDAKSLQIIDQESMRQSQAPPDFQEAFSPP